MLVEQVFCSLSDFSLFFEQVCLLFEWFLVVFSSRSVFSLSNFSLFFAHDVLGWFASHDALIVYSLVDAQKLLVLRSLAMHVVLCSSSSCKQRQTTPASSNQVKWRGPVRSDTALY